MFLILEFLIAIEMVFTFWSQVGGQYHLDLMFWPWKFGISLAREPGVRRRRMTMRTAIGRRGLRGMGLVDLAGTGFIG